MGERLRLAEHVVNGAMASISMGKGTGETMGIKLNPLVMTANAFRIKIFTYLFHFVTMLTSGSQVLDVVLKHIRQVIPVRRTKGQFNRVEIEFLAFVGFVGR